MTVTPIFEPPAFLRELGELHDVRVLTATYDVERQEIEISVHDLNWDFERHEGYLPRPCTLVFSGVSAFSIAAGQDKFHTSIATGEPAAIAHSYAITKNGVTRLDIVMATSEQWFVEFVSLGVRDLDIRAS